MTDLVVIEDDMSLGAAMARMLRTAGFSVRVFGSAEEYLACIHAGGPDCLVCDVALPGLSGFDLVEALASPRYRPPAIFISAHDSNHVRDEARRLGRYLPKPFTGEELLDAIRANVGRPH